MTEARRTPSIRRPNEGGIVDFVRQGSLAEQAGLRPGDHITAIDDRRLRDAVDFQFLAAEDVIQLEVRRDDRPLLIEIEKHPDEDLGIDFQDAAFDGVRTCNNSCFFCFLKGNPKGLRKTLYVKDDDYRLSFFHGNFVTLTNLTDDDWTRIGEQRLSPLNVSVHATDVELRRYLLGNRGAPDICAQLRRLGAMGIEANTQVVLCPGVNDGAALNRTIEDLSALYPTVRTISIVPVGATMTAEERIAKGVHGDEIAGCTRAHARAVIAQVAPHQRGFRRDTGHTLVYLADEYYLTAGVRLPAAAQYDGFAQFENGIGMARTLIDDWKKTRRSCEHKPPQIRSSSIRNMTMVCGVLIAPTLAELARELEQITGVRTRVRPIENRFFGARVNVSGLLTSRDLIDQLAGEDVGDLAVFPRYALDYTGGRFLDDTTPQDLQRALSVPVAFASTLREVLQIIGEPLSSEVIGADAGATTNGKAWVDYSEGGALEASQGA